MSKVKDFTEIELDKIKEAPWNFKKTDPGAQKRLVENVRRNGQIQNINVRELCDGMYEVIDGNHRLAAYRELGLPTALCYNHGPITLAEAMRVAMECREYFRADTLKQAVAMREVALHFGLDALAETSALERGQLADVLSIADIDRDSLDDALAREVRKEKKESLSMAIRCTTLERREKLLAALRAKCESIGAPPDSVGLGIALHEILKSRGLL